MLHRWLDGRDEKRAQRGEAHKEAVPFALGSKLAFPRAGDVQSIDAFAQLAASAAADPSWFDLPAWEELGVSVDGQSLTFASPIQTDIEVNNTVHARIEDSGRKERAVIVFHHWNASSRMRPLAKLLAAQGMTVLEIAMPYHFERMRPGSAGADYMLGPNLGRTLQSIRQAVLDGRKLVRWLKAEGYGEISVVGMSLGSWIAGLVAAHDREIAKASLLLTAGSLAQMVWTGRATRLIRQSMEGEITLGELERAWSPVDLESHLDLLARPDLDLQVILAQRDTVVLPALSEKLVEELTRRGARPDTVRLNCGHYTLSYPPFIFYAGWRLVRFLRSM